MGTMTYAEQLRHPFWQRKRLTCLEAAGWECTQCGAKENTLHVHHKRYVKGRKAWEYEDDELAVLCDKCHLDEHALRELLDEMLSKSNTWRTLESVVGLVGGFLSASYAIDQELEKRARAAYGPCFTIGVVAHACALTNCGQLAAFVRAAYDSLPGGPRPLDPAISIEVALLEARAAEPVWEDD